MTIDDLKALSDSELNRLAAEVVMGWHLAKVSRLQWLDEYGNNWLDDEERFARMGQVPLTFDTWQPATDHNNAAMLEEKLAKGGWYLGILPATCSLLGTVYFMQHGASDNGIRFKTTSERPRALSIAAIYVKEQENVTSNYTSL